MTMHKLLKKRSVFLQYGQGPEEESYQNSRIPRGVPTKYLSQPPSYNKGSILTILELAGWRLTK